MGTIIRVQAVYSFPPWDITPKLENGFVQRFMEARIWKKRAGGLGFRVHSGRDIN